MEESLAPERKSFKSILIFFFFLLPTLIKYWHYVIYPIYKYTACSVNDVLGLLKWFKVILSSTENWITINYFRRIPFQGLSLHRCHGFLAPAKFLDSSVWHPRILSILLHSVVLHP